MNQFQKTGILTMLCLLASILPVFPQHVINFKSNGLMTNSLVRKSINYIDAGESGENKLWDFSGQLHANGNDVISIRVDSLNKIAVVYNGKLDSLIMKKDSLFLLSAESPLDKAEYKHGALLMHYPLCYGDSIAKPFIGYGRYCGNHYYKQTGQMIIQADRYGDMIISEDDTLKNVLRVYCLRSYSVAMDMDSAALDTSRLRQVIEEHYLWYARGCRYPVVESLTSTSYIGLSAIGTIHKAWCFLPDDQSQLTDYINQDIRKNDSLESVRREEMEKDIFHYTVTVENGHIHLKYNLDEDAHISALVSSAMGIVYKRREWSGKSGDAGFAEIDCNGLRHGQYVLYINVNGKIYSKKVTL